MNFLRSCVAHESAFLRYIVLHGLLYARGFSFVSQNVLLCAQRFECSCDDLIYNSSVNKIINLYALKSVSDDVRRSSEFLMELLMIRDNFLKLSSDMFSTDELKCIIEYICT